MTSSLFFGVEKIKERVERCETITYRRGKQGYVVVRVALGEFKLQLHLLHPERFFFSFVRRMDGTEKT